MTLNSQNCDIMSEAVHFAFSFRRDFHWLEAGAKVVTMHLQFDCKAKLHFSAMLF